MGIKNANNANKAKTNKKKTFKKRAKPRKSNKSKTARRKSMKGGTTGGIYNLGNMNQVGKLYNDMNFQKTNTFEINPSPLSNLV